MTSSIQQKNLELEDQKHISNQIRSAIASRITGQDHLIQSLLICLYCGGHALLEGLPGLAKTLTIKTLASAIQASFSRIQFTPDLLPADVVGTLIYSPRKEEFTVKKGPLFANLILADEINRAPAKVQSALLEAMQEKQVTIGDESISLLEPFMVMATQNPIEQEGTYPLPEAQLDRFLMKIIVSYPSAEEELTILQRDLNPAPLAKISGVTAADITTVKRLVRSVHIDESLERYIVGIVLASRFPDKLPHLKGLLSFGASPRATLGLAHAAQAHALLRGSGYVEPDDIKAVAYDVLRHRIGISFEGLAENLTTTTVIEGLLATTPVP